MSHSFPLTEPGPVGQPYWHRPPVTGLVPASTNKGNSRICFGCRSRSTFGEDSNPSLFLKKQLVTNLDFFWYYWTLLGDWCYSSQQAAGAAMSPSPSQSTHRQLSPQQTTHTHTRTHTHTQTHAHTPPAQSSNYKWRLIEKHLQPPFNLTTRVLIMARYWDTQNINTIR